MSLPKPRADLKPNTADFERLPLVKPTASTAFNRFSLLPSPNWPLSFHPQHLVAPAVVTAQVYPSPAATRLTAAEPSAVTAMG